MSLQQGLFAAAAPAMSGDAALPSPTIHESSATNIMDRAVCLSVELHRLGTKRKVSSNEVSTDADRSMIHVSKDILESDALKAIQSFDGEVRTYIGKRCLPSMFRAGVYLLPMDLINEVDAELTRRAEQRKLLVLSFIEDYTLARDAARRRLGSLYDDRDYPGLDKVRAQFGMDHKFLAFATPGRLRAVSPELFERETAKFQAMIADATDEITTLLRSSMAGLVDHLVDKLSPDPTGKKKIFRDSLVGNVREFLETFQARNIADDAALGALVAQAERLLDGVDANDLRDSSRLRDRVARGFGEIKTALDSMLVDAPRRKVVFDED